MLNKISYNNIYNNKNLLPYERILSSLCFEVPSQIFKVNINNIALCFIFKNMTYIVDI